MSISYDNPRPPKFKLLQKVVYRVVSKVDDKLSIAEDISFYVRGISIRGKGTWDEEMNGLEYHYDLVLEKPRVSSHGSGVFKTVLEEDISAADES